ncbi:hypothetical protein CAP36_11805 [Chitinophagaceae bacterium IBVUCB2]|nr:hypothetical protein CAP36_11805 [Chitinophagaceae bacterium IBVUCB2]
MSRIRKFGMIMLFGIVGCKSANKNVPVSSNEESMTMDKVRLKDLKENAINMGEYKGKTVFINFWATWCRPCLEEMPSIQAAINKLKNESIVFLFASDEASEDIENFKTSHSYNFNFVKVENLEELNIMTLPTTYIFDQKGKLVFSEMGYKKWDDIQNTDLILNIIKAK